MITLIEAKNYRCLQYIRQPLGPFHVLVGPNASGKTTFLDVVAFLGDLVSGGLDEAIGKRTQNYNDLIWGRQGTGFELAIEARIPGELRKSLKDGYDTVRFEIELRVQESSGEFILQNENLLLMHQSLGKADANHIGEFPGCLSIPESILTSEYALQTRPVIRKHLSSVSVPETELFPEKDPPSGVPMFVFGPRRSTLGNLPEDERVFPISSWFKRLLRQSVQSIDLRSDQLRRAARPGQGRTFKSDGSNLPWVVDALRTKSAQSFQRWIAHLQTALPDLVDIDTAEVPDIMHRYLVLCYEGGLRVPSWMASDGTLRLIALTLVAYLPDIAGVYLIEEPENGIHPRAIETIFQSLSSVYEAQVLLATHSPVVLGVTDASDVLCFSKTDEGAANIVPGNEHPALSNWHGETNLGVLFAGGVLG